MREPSGPNLAPATVGQAPQLLLIGIAGVAFVVTWHTLVQDFELSVAVAGLLAGTQALALATVLRWPRGSWIGSTMILLSGALAARAAGGDGLWPDPNLYVHLAVLFVAGMRCRVGELVAMASVVVVSGVLLDVTSSATTGSPGLAESVGLVVATLTVAGVLGRAARGRDRALAELAIQQRAVEAERVRVALLEERARIGRELHDVVAHHLTVVAMQAEAGPLRVSNPPAALTAAFSAIRGNELDGLNELRRLVGLLRDVDEESTTPQPGMADIEELVENVRGAGVDIELRVAGEPAPTSPGLQLSVFRIVQKSPNNAMRHAPGAAVTIEIRHLDGHIALEIENEPTPSSVTRPGPGHGLVGMRERVALFGGRLQAASTAQGGSSSQPASRSTQR